jgi:hypothetical protein
MIESMILLLTSNVAAVFNVAFSIIAIASSIAAITKTPSDDKWVGKVYKIIDVLALNFGYAKDKPAEQAGGRFVAN